MSNGDTREYTLGLTFRDEDLTTLYWLNDGKICYRHYPIRGADADSFRFYLGSFAKDRKHCYCTFSRLAGGNAATFRALNYTYATDGQSVWTLGGRIKDADAESFIVCDDGSYDIGRNLRVPHGFGKDKDRVFFYDYDGKPNWVRKASPQSFVSLSDGHFGQDEQFVFFGAVTLPKAKVQQWRKLGGYYSTDDTRVFYANREIKDADVASFEVIRSPIPSRDFIQAAKDRNHYYSNDRIVDLREFEDHLYGKDGKPR